MSEVDQRIVSELRKARADMLGTKFEREYWVSHQAADALETASSEDSRKTDLIKLLLKECEEMGLAHTNACMNSAPCEHSQIECALCQLRIAVSGTQS